MALPSDDAIRQLGETGDVLRYAIVGFSAIELAIEDLIAEALPSPHPIELRKLSFRFKADLAIGLGSLRRESKGLLVLLAKIRNYYAHEFAPGTDYCTAGRLIASMGKSHRAMAAEHLEKAVSFAEALRVSFIVAYYDIRESIERVKRHKSHRKEAAEQAEAILSVIGPKYDALEKDPYPGFLEAKKNLDEKIRKKREELKRREK